MAGKGKAKPVEKLVAVEVEGEPTPRRQRLPLRTQDDVAAELARVYRAAKQGAMPTQDATRLAYILTQLRQTIEAVELERRIDALEATLNQPRRLN